MGGGATQPNIFTDKKETSSNFTEPHNQNTLWDYCPRVRSKFIILNIYGLSIKLIHIYKFIQAAGLYSSQSETIRMDDQELLACSLNKII